MPNGKYNTIVHSYESKPEGSGPFPAIVLFMHAHGLDDFSKKVCDDLADAGYLAVAADGYLNGTYSFQTRNDDAILGAADLLIHTLKNRDDVVSDRIGAIGFCMGGRHAYLANAKWDIFKAVVSYYGFPHRGSSPEDTPINLVDSFNGPVLSIFGSEDRGIPMDAVEAYQKASEGPDKPHKSIVYDGAGHGFLNFNSRNFHEEAAKDAWERTLEFFREHLL